MNFQDLAKSEYYDVVMQDLQIDIDELMQPENIPEDSLENVKAHKRLMEHLKAKQKQLTKLRKLERSEIIEDSENDDEFE